MADAALDHDVLLKAVCYGLLEEVLQAVPVPPHVYGVLGTARYVLPKALKKRPPRHAEVATALLNHALDILEILEPTNEETRLAAALEFEATRQLQSLHMGECQLCAMLILRGFNHLLTGDKQAIRALAEMTLPEGVIREALLGRLVCLEQAMLWLCQALGPAHMRERVCAEPDVDPGMRICFSCVSPEIGQESWLEGLLSHINELRATAGPLLMPGPA
jgi:hypothetical protein